MPATTPCRSAPITTTANITALGAHRRLHRRRTRSTTAPPTPPWPRHARWPARCTGDVVTLSGGTATFADKNVGTGKTVTLTGAVLARRRCGQLHAGLGGHHDRRHHRRSRHGDRRQQVQDGRSTRPRPDLHRDDRCGVLRRQLQRGTHPHSRRDRRHIPDHPGHLGTVEQLLPGLRPCHAHDHSGHLAGCRSGGSAATTW